MQAVGGADAQGGCSATRKQVRQALGDGVRGARPGDQDVALAVEQQVDDLDQTFVHLSGQRADALRLAVDHLARAGDQAGRDFGLCCG